MPLGGKGAAIPMTHSHTFHVAQHRLESAKLLGAGGGGVQV